MRRWLSDFDELLRGSKAGPACLPEKCIGPYVWIPLLLGIFYGACMGLYAVLARATPLYEQLIASGVKVPLLFFLTLVVTFPSLYVFSALLGANLKPWACLRVVLAANAVNMAVLASFGTITGFFTLTTTSYVFIKLLNVLFFAIAGVMGLGFLMKMLKRICSDQQGLFPGQPLPLPEPSQARHIFQVWIILYALVGAQMGWILRPFIGAPELPFTWFRARESNFFIDVFKSIIHLIGG